MDRAPMTAEHSSRSPVSCVAATRATSTSCATGARRDRWSTSAAASSSTGSTSSASSASRTSLVTHHHRDQVQGLARAVAAGRPDLGAAARARADRGRRPSTGRRRRSRTTTTSAQDRFSLLESGARWRVPSRSTARGGTAAFDGLHPADARPHGRARSRISSSVDGARHRLLRRPRLRRRQGLVARGDAVVVQRRRGAGGDASSPAACSPTASRTCCCPRTASRSRTRRRALARACAHACRSSSTCASRQPLGPRRHATASPWAPVTPHLLRNRATLRQQLRAALGVRGGAADRLRLRRDDGARPEHGARRRGARSSGRSTRSARDHGVERIEAAIATHYHDDHVAGSRPAPRGRGH